MWLPRRQLSPDATIAEFDQWVTPSLGSVRDSARFQAELQLLQVVVEGVSSVMMEEGITPTDALRAELLRELREPDTFLAGQRLVAMLSILFLVTAKSDNALKCQYPLHYRKTHGENYPRVLGRKLVRTRTPDVIKAVDVVALALRVRDIDSEVALQVVERYVAFLLADETDKRQFATLVEAYSHCDTVFGRSGRDLLAPLVAFQVRGSVAASGGHDPEAIVRKYLAAWGLAAGVHFNTSDVTASALNNWLADANDSQDGRERIDASSDKTRAFDFILPFQTPAASRRIFIQSQFYAGDSGSVSHKNVDQASKARTHAAEMFSDARFVELVDGAGYCASLRKDLKHLLFASDTDDFVQLRSIPVRLRRILQESGVVAPLDIALLVAAGSGTALELENDVVAHGVPDARAWIERALATGWIGAHVDGGFAVCSSKLEIVRRYELLDELVASSGPIVDHGEYYLVPGYGPNYGAAVRESWETDDMAFLVAGGLVEKWTNHA